MLVEIIGIDRKMKYKITDTSSKFSPDLKMCFVFSPLVEVPSNGKDLKSDFVSSTTPRIRLNCIRMEYDCEGKG